MVFCTNCTTEKCQIGCVGCFIHHLVNKLKIDADGYHFGICVALQDYEARLEQFVNSSVCFCMQGLISFTLPPQKKNTSYKIVSRLSAKILHMRMAQHLALLHCHGKA